MSVLCSYIDASDDFKKEAIAVASKREVDEGSLILIRQFRESVLGDCCAAQWFTVTDSGVAQATAGDFSTVFGVDSLTLINDAFSQLKSGDQVLFSWKFPQVDKIVRSWTFDLEASFKYIFVAADMAVVKKVSNGYGGWDYNFYKS